MPGNGPFGRFVVEVASSSRRPVEVEFAIRRDTVEVWLGKHCAGVMDRATLRAWLAAPAGPLVVDEVMWARAESGVALVVADIGWWPLVPHVLDGLRGRV